MSFALCNKAFVKHLFTISKKEATINYRYYLIAKAHFGKRSGIFSLDEFLDILHTHYGFKSLHRKPGNNRTRYKKRFLTIFSHSPIFSVQMDGRIKYVPEKKIISARELRHASRIRLDLADLSQGKIFTDRIIGIISTGNQLKSYQTMAEQTHFSRRRCIQAAKQNNDDQKFIKYHNYILVKSSKYISDINRERDNLLSIHNIHTPEPVKYLGEWHLCLYAPNSYATVSFDAEHTKQNHEDIPFDRADLTPFIQSQKCYFKLIPTGSNLYRRFSTTNFLTFNEDNFSYERYVNTFSHRVGEVRSAA
jgi:hypothetical protein